MDAPRQLAVLVSCEHAGNTVPPEAAPCFRGPAAARALTSHRGYDIGALGVARRLASRLGVVPILTTVSRLVVEANRSPGHAKVFSEFTGGLPEPERRALLDHYYTPHRAAVERAVSRLVGRGFAVLHAGVHSFTPVLDDEVRAVKVGLLFDPARRLESQICERWRDAIRSADPALDPRFNEPYKGIDDGLTTFLRTRFADDDYAGIEIEVRNDLIRRGVQQRAMGSLLAETMPRSL